MRRLIDSIHTLTIANGQTASNAIVLGGFLKACSIYAPATLPETVSVQIEPSAGGTDFCTLQSGGTDVTVPAGKVAMIMEGAFRQIRMLAGSAVAADRVFRISVVIDP